MKKVLFIATITEHINSFHIPYLKWFKEQGYEVHVASKGTNDVEYCDKHFDLSFERFPMKKNNIKAYKELKKIIDGNNGTKVIYTVHGFHFYKGASISNWLIYYPIEKIMAKYTDYLITINQEDYEFAKKHLKAQQIELVHGVGMDTKRFQKEISEREKEEKRKELEIENDDIVLTYIAEINKNQILLIKAVEILKESISNIKLLLIGNGDFSEEYIKVVKDKQLEANIKFMGQRNDINEILSITNIYVASSIREGLPVNIMEAMYKKLPIVATDNRGHKQLVIDNKTGYIIKDTNNPKLLVEKIIELLNDKEKIKEFGNNAKENVKKYQIENVIKEMEKIYNHEK